MNLYPAESNYLLLKFPPSTQLPASVKKQTLMIKAHLASSSYRLTGGKSVYLCVCMPKNRLNVKPLLSSLLFSALRVTRVKKGEPKPTVHMLTKMGKSDKN